MKPSDKGKTNESKCPRRSACQPRPELGCLELLALLKSGQIKGRCVHRTDRLRMVEYIHGDAITGVAETAKLFQRNEKTIREDIKRIREANALKADPGFAEEFAGEVLALARSVEQHLGREGRDKATPPAVRVKAQRGRLRALLEVGLLLQSLGHLPSAALRLKMEPIAAPEGPASMSDVLADLDKLIGVAAAQSPQDVPLLSSLRDVVRTAPPPVRPPTTEPAAPATEPTP